MEIVRHARGASILDGDDVLSEVLAVPGPTHTLFDVLAAGIAALANGPRVAVLGFAAGGLVAPLRGMGCTLPLHCVDMSRRGERLFRELSRGWARDVHVDEDDAVRWLRRQRKPFDCILEDLSLPATREREGVKPDVSLEEIPGLMRQRLTPGGVAIVNLLPMPEAPWRQVMSPFQAVFPRVQVVHLDGYVNRILVMGRRLPAAHTTSRALRAALHEIQSAMAYELHVRTLARSHPAR